MNWKYYNTSILESSSSTEHSLFANYDDTYITSFKEKLKIVKQDNFSAAFNYAKKLICFAQFYPLIMEPVWINIACNITFTHVYFICESEIRISKRFPGYLRATILCDIKFTYAKGKCWRIVKQYTTTTRLLPKQLEELQDDLSAWSFGHSFRKIVGIGNYDNLQYCLKTYSFSIYRLKTFIESSDCGDAKPNYTLVSRTPSQYSIICNTNSQYRCDLNSCILNTYVCDGIDDCFDKSDENNCKVPLTSYTLACADNMNDSCDNKILTSNGCADLYYECYSGECVPLAHLCDHHSHCADNSDEIHCTSYKLKEMMTSVSPIKVGFFVVLIKSIVYLQHTLTDL